MTALIQAIFIITTLSLAQNSAHALGRANPFHDNRPDAASGILNAFQTGCSSLGSWSSAARAQTDSLINIVNALKGTQACQPFAAELLTIQTLTGQIQAIQTDEAYRTYFQDEETLQLLMLNLKTAPAESELANNLQKAMTDLQQKILLDRAAYDSKTKINNQERIAKQTGALASYMQNLLFNAASSPTIGDCLNTSPGASIQLAGNLLAFSGSFMPPVYGAGTAILSQLVNLGISQLRQSQYNSAAFEAQRDQMPDALNCALESMSEFYCNAEDSYQLLELARKNRDQKYEPTALWRGLDLVGRQMPALVAWLDKVKNGVPPTDNFQSSKQISVLSKVLIVQSTNLQMIAAFNDAISSYNSTQDTNLKNPFIINTIASASCELGDCSNGQNMGRNNSSPFVSYQSSPFEWACWLVSGYDAKCPPPGSDMVSDGGSGSLQGVIKYIKSTLLNEGAAIPTVVPLLLPNWQSIVSKVENYVNIEFAKTITTNAGALISAAFERKSGSHYPISPIEALKNTSVFIQEMMNYTTPKNPRRQALLALKKQKIDRAIWYLEANDDQVCIEEKSAPNPAPTPGASTALNASRVPRTFLTDPDEDSPENKIDECNRHRLVKLFKLFNLKDSSRIFATDIDELVAEDLQGRFENGEFPADKTNILKTAGIDLWIRLQAAGLGDLEDSKNDLNNARADTEGNLRAFRNFFVKEFEAAVKHEAKLMQGEDLEGPDRPHGEKLAHLCTWWLVSGRIPESPAITYADWPSNEVERLCADAAIYSGNDNMGTDGRYTPAIQVGELKKKLESLPFKRRICEYHKYKLKNRAKTILPEILQEK